jgi:hypothetical protein
LDFVALGPALPPVPSEPLPTIQLLVSRWHQATQYNTAFTLCDYTVQTAKLSLLVAKHIALLVVI